MNNSNGIKTFPHPYFSEQEPYQCVPVVRVKSCDEYEYNLTSLYHDPAFSDSLYFQGDTGDLTYINLCGDTTTTCSPSSPVCRRCGLWATMGFGELDSQKFYPIRLSSSSFLRCLFILVTYAFVFDGKQNLRESSQARVLL